MLKQFEKFHWFLEEKYGCWHSCQWDYCFISLLNTERNLKQIGFTAGVYSGHGDQRFLVPHRTTQNIQKKKKKITFGCSGFTLCFKMLKWCKTMSHYRKQGKHNLHGSTRAHMKFTGSCTAPLLPLLPTAQHLTSRPQQDSAVTGSLTDIPCLAQKACIML